MNSTKKIFAESLSFYKYFWIFIIFSVVGSIYEELLFTIKHYFVSGEIIHELRRGVIYGPFNVVYGFGACVIMFLFVKHNYSYLKTFLYGTITGGVIEYTISFLFEFFIGNKSWDYSNQILNINGRTTIPIMIFWGICILLFVKYIYPKVSLLIEKILTNFGNKITKILVILMVFDMAISWGALIRQTFRRNNVKPFSPVGVFYDNHYNDQKLKYYFPNMKVAKRR